MGEMGDIGPGVAGSGSVSGLVRAWLGVRGGDSTGVSSSCDPSSFALTEPFRLRQEYL